MVSERVNLIHKTSPYGKKKKNAKSLHPTIREGIDFLFATYPWRNWFSLSYLSL